MIRPAAIGLSAALSALGMALLARPAFFWVDELGLFRPAPAWHVPAGWAAALLACAVAALTLIAALRVSAGRKLRRSHHLALLLLVGLALAARASLPLDRLPLARRTAAAPVWRPATPLLPVYPNAR